MKRTSNLSRLLKLSQQDNTEAWQALKAEAESDSIPEGVVDIAAIQKSAADSEKLLSKAKEAKAASDTMTKEDKQQLASALNDPEFWKIVQASNSGAIKNSEFIDSLFIKFSSRYFEEDESRDILRDINLYKNLNNLENKIASANNPISELFEKQAAFNRLYKDASFLNESLILKISEKYSDLIIKQAASGTSTWDEVKNIGSKALELGGKGLSYIGKGIKYTFKFIGTIMPFIGVYLSAKDCYESYKNVSESLERIKQNFSDLGQPDNLTDPKQISSLISKFVNDPEKLLRIAVLNKVAKFYKENWWNQWYSVLWFISDLIYSFGITAAVIGSGGIAGVGAVIAAPLEALTVSVLGKAVTNIAGKAGLASLVGTIATSFFGAGLGGYEENKIQLINIADMHLSYAESPKASPEVPSKTDPEVSRKRKETDEEKNQRLERTFKLIDEFSKS